MPEPAPASWLKLAHAADYVDQVITCSVPEKIEREIGFPVGPRVSLRAQLAAGGTVLAARLALVNGIACNSAGGSHHARHAQGAGSGMLSASRPANPRVLKACINSGYLLIGKR